MFYLNRENLFYTIGTAFLVLAATFAASAQTNATRRLSVAINGFQFNEAAAKDALAAGADINWQNDAMDGETMLITAIKGYQEPNVFRFLLDHGADPSIKDETGKTALEWAHARNIGRNRNGREIIAMLETGAGAIPAAETTGGLTTTAGTKTDPRQQGKTETAPTGSITTHRTSGPPSTDDVKQAIEKKFTNDYIRHFFGVDNKITFEWTGSIVVGALQSVRSAPKPCYPVKLQVTLTAEDPRDGNIYTVVRGLNATTGNYREEIFCLYRDGFGEWDFGLYGK
jgi:Ankyrin repeats (many copies)